MVLPSYLFNGGTGGPALLTDSILTQTSLTSVSLEPIISTLTVTPTKYSVYWVKILNDGSESGNAGDSGTVESTSIPVLITGLTSGDTYRFKTRAYSGSAYGNGITSPDFVLAKDAVNYTAIASTLDPKQVTAGKSYLTLTNNNPSQKSYSLIYRDFDAINLPTGLGVIQTNPSGVDTPVTSYSTVCYSFGTTFFLDSNIEKPNQGGGIGFFLSGQGSDGYYIFVESTSLSASQDNKSVRIVKVQGNKVYVLKDTQSSSANTLEGIYGGKSYSIDVKVKVSGINVEIIAYVNGFKITATDKTNYLAVVPTKILGPTERVGLLCTKGIAKFDYVYGTDISGEQYADSSYILNFYQGQFSNDLLNTSFGDLTYYADNSTDVYNSKKTMVDEFGTTVREIIKQKIRFQNPSYPVKWTTGGNKLAQLIGYKVNNFGGEAYVLNNASTTIPLSDTDNANFYLFGNTLGQSGTLEYTTDELSDYVTKEPVIFESKWLQNLSDVKSLAEWIKTKSVNRGKIVNMSVFGNPLISVGDIVTIKYTYQGFAGTEKLIVTNVMHKYIEGLETSISCRTLG
jgi:hypothetical protein